MNERDNRLAVLCTIRMEMRAHCAVVVRRHGQGPEVVDSGDMQAVQA